MNKPNNNLSKISQPSLENILKHGIDAVVCSSGYESRSSYLAKKLFSYSPLRFCIGHAEKREIAARIKNDEIYESLGFACKELSGDSSSGAQQLLLDILLKINKPECHLVLDISSMTRAWYGGFVHALATQKLISKVLVDYLYVPSKFQRIYDKVLPNETSGPLEGFFGLAPADLPTALVMCLGSEPRRSIGIVEELDPTRKIVFYANPSVDDKYVTEALEVNKDILKRTDESNIFTFPVRDSVGLLSNLESLCSGLMKHYRVVLTSMGPKIFSLCCFIVASQYPEISVWRITTGTHGDPIDHQPTDEIISLEVEWSSLESK